MAIPTMKAAQVFNRGNMQVTEKPVPSCPPDSLLIKVEACAICGSDVRIFKKGDSRAAFPIVIGHEIAGRIVEVGSRLKDFTAGERVCVAPGHGCGECRYCLSGNSNVCINPHLSIGYALDGGFAEYMVPPSNVVALGFVNRIPRELSFNHASISEVIACCLNAQENCPVKQGDTVLIFGAGPAGCVHSLLSKLNGARKVLMTQRSSARLKLARDRLGSVNRIVVSDEQDLTGVVMEETSGLGADVVYVCAPSAEAQVRALELAAPRARVNFFSGLPRDGSKISFDANVIHYKELFVSGASSSLARQNRQALELLAGGTIDAERLITHRFSLDNILDGFEMVEKKIGIKAVIQPNRQIISE
jgi:L-iditol 2-dehydrogenase